MNSKDIEMMGNGWGKWKEDRYWLNTESLNLFLLLMNEKKYSARECGDMVALVNRLKGEGKSEELIDAVIWRFRNLSGLC